MAAHQVVDELGVHFETLLVTCLIRSIVGPCPRSRDSFRVRWNDTRGLRSSWRNRLRRTRAHRPA